MRGVAALAIVLGVVAGLTACGGGGEAEPTATGATTTAAAAHATASPTSSTAATPATTATVEDRAEIEALLKAMALQLEDLPSGFTLEEERFRTNEEAALDYIDGEEQGLANFARWGRLLGYQATYSTEASLGTLMTGGTIYIDARPTLYEDSNGAGEAMADTRERLSDPEQSARFVEDFEKDSSWKDVELAVMSFARVGDDTLAFQVTGKVSSSQSELELPAVAQVVTIRRGRALGGLIVAAAQAPSPIEELEAMASKFDQRMKEALE